MNEAQQVIQRIYDNNLESRLRLIADDLNVRNASGHREPRIKPAHTPKTTVEDAAVAEPSGIYNPVYIGDKHGLTVTANPHELHDAYAALIQWPTQGPYIQPKDNTALNVHYHDPTQKTTPTRIEDTDMPVYDQAHLAHYLQGPNPRKHEFGVTTIEINPDKHPSDGLVGVTNDEAYHARRLLNMNNTPLGNQTSNPSHAKDIHITKKYR